MAKSKQKKSYKLHERKTSLDSIKEMMFKSPSRAMGDLMNHLEKYPEDMYAWHYYGRLATEQANYSEAKFAFTKVAESKSWNKYAGVVGLGDIARIQGHRELAKKYYLQAIEENPYEKERTFCVLARAECADNHFAKAIKALELCERPGNEILIEKLRVYVLMGDEEKVKMLSEQIVPTNNNERMEILYEQAKLAMQQSKKRVALKLLAKAKALDGLEKEREYYKMLNTEAMLATEVGDYELAERNCNQSLADKDNGYGEVYVTLGRAKQLRGDFHDALSNYYLAIATSNATHDTKQLATLYASILETAVGNPNKAEKILKDSMTYPDEPYSANVEILCGIYYHEGRYEEIKELLSKYSGNVKDSKLHSSLRFIDLIVKKTLGEPLPSKAYCSYREAQVVEYNKTAAISHIKLRHQGIDATTSFFASDIDIEALYEDVLLQLTDKTRVRSDMTDKYLLEFPYAGYSPDGEIIHVISVITLPGTKEIITMYPECDIYPITQQNIADYKEKYMKQREENSRITKFKKRYESRNTD